MGIYVKVCLDCDNKFRVKEGVDMSYCRVCVKRRKADEKRRNRLIGQLRSCWSCSAVYPLTSDNFPPSEKSEIGRLCVQCFLNRIGEKQQVLLRTAIKAKGYKCCANCNEWKPFNEFHRNSQQADDYNTRCKDCVKVYQQENHERIIAKTREWQKANPEKVSSHVSRWQKANPEKAKKLQRIAAMKRRTRKEGLPSGLTIQDWQRALDYFNGYCAVCGRQLKDLFGTHTAAADHWIPITYEGADNPGTVATNIVPLCHGIDGCNNHKSAKLPDVWLKEQFGTRKANIILKRVEDYFEWVRNQEIERLKT